MRDLEIIDNTSHTAKKKKNIITGTNERVEIKTRYDAFDNKLVAEVMDRCGEFLTEFKAAPRPSTLLDLDANDHYASCYLDLVAKHCSNIETLTTTVKNEIDDEKLYQVLLINKKVKNLDVSIVFNEAHRCFFKILSDHLERLKIRIILHEESHQIGAQKLVIANCPSLKELSIHCCDDELLELIGHKLMLEKLELFLHNLQLPNMELTKMGFTSILKLRNLREMTLNGSNAKLPITDDFMMALSDNLTLLEVIKISNAEFISNNGFKSLASLTKLRELSITNCRNVTDEFLLLFSGLDILNMSGCPRVQDTGVINLLEKAVTMRYLGLAKTQITLSTLIAASNASKKRSNGILLQLTIPGFGFAKYPPYHSNFYYNTQ